jgi:type VI secretion system secreted protein Hcp
MFRNITATVLTITTLLASSPAIAAHEAYMTVKGQKAGVVKGGATAKGQEGSIVVLSTSLAITSPRDATSGLPTGQRVHQPIVITKELDKSSPILWNMLVTNENISNVTIKYVRAAANGAEPQIYQIKLTNASISSITFHQPNSALADSRAVNEYEDVTFTYQKIEWTWNDGGITSTDEWTAR